MASQAIALFLSLSGPEKALAMADHFFSEENPAPPALLTSEARYRAFYEQAAVGIVHCGLDGRVIKVNDNFANFVGYRREELETQDCLAITFLEDADGDRLAQDGLLSGTFSQVEQDKRFIRGDGTFVWGHVTLSLLRDEAGQPVELLSVVQNIYDRKLAEDALRESEHRHRVIFENSPLGMVRFDASGTIRDCNGKFLELAGASRTKLIGFNTARQSQPEMQAALKKALAGESSVYEGDYTSVTAAKPPA